ncbi:uncharacterized protein [Choristoneura fumiferana]|uniref:uncharacterized protein n=1 Tax=Choristoneura fumiferana TaxID=7141 RepID=UPI003D15C96C
MLFYRLVICRLMAFLGLDELYKEKERRAIMLGKKKKPFHKPQLLMNENMQTFTFMILAGINMLFMLTLPLAVLKEPCEAFKKCNMLNFYAFTVTVKKYATFIDRIMILMFVALVIVGVKTVLDAIAVTKINLSPWLEQGKYVLPGRKCCDHKVRDPAKERAEARARAKYYDKISEEIYKQYEESNGRFFDREFYKMYYGSCHNHYDLIFNDKSSLNSNRTYRQTSDQANDQTNDQTFDLKYNETYDQTFDLADDQTYDQNFDQTFDRLNDRKFDLAYQEYLHQACYDTPEQTSDEISDQSSELSSGEMSETDSDNEAW